MNTGTPESATIMGMECLGRKKSARGIPTRKDLSDALVRVREERIRRVPVPANGTMTYAEYVRMTGDDRISRMARCERVDA